MSKNVLIVTATEQTLEDFKRDSVLYKSYLLLKKVYEDKLDIHVVSNNTTGLSTVYNKFLVNKYKDTIVAFIHDDVEILSVNLVDALNDSTWDITGLAGGTEYSIKESCMWHLSCPPEKLSGAVSHPVVIRNSDGTLQGDTKNQAVSYYGSWPSRCTVIDGLFMAVKVDRALQTNFKFDEDFNFHFYDISSCILANQCKMTVGTHPIHVHHLGLGDSAFSDSWKQSHKKFINKWLR